MRYRLGMRDDGWLVADTAHRRVAEFGGVRLDGLSADEAHVLLGLVEAAERGAAAGPETREPPPPPARRDLRL